MSTTTPVAVITGAARGIGRRSAEVLASRGYAIALNDITSTADAQATVRANGAEAIETLGDVSSETDVARIADTVLTHFGRVDVLVNNVFFNDTPTTEK